MLIKFPLFCSQIYKAQLALQKGRKSGLEGRVLASGIVWWEQRLSVATLMRGQPTGEPPW